MLGGFLRKGGASAFRQRAPQKKLAKSAGINIIIYLILIYKNCCNLKKLCYTYKTGLKPEKRQEERFFLSLSNTKK
jgi:hypothetical protein